ncbi:MAG: carboxypeptidase-like regulatory domain-containing protein [Chitinophagaceae bacterium]
MKNTLVLLLACCFTVSAFSQKEFTVLGKVVDSATGLPLTGASAFCQNTTQGTITNDKGLFFLRLPNGGYDLVISYTGYQKYQQRISNGMPATDTLIIALPKEDKTMTEVAIVATGEVEDGLAKYGSFFMDHFIGTTPNAAQCTVVNPEVLHFFYTKKRNRLKVMAQEDIIIRNNALGYTIRYQLDSFSYDYNNNVTQYTGSPLFQEIDTTDAVKTEWKKRRARTYLGSRLHFMRSLYDSTVANEGFIVEKLDDEDLKNVKGTPVSNLYSEDIYTQDSGSAIINWEGRYRVSYKSVLPDKKFLQEFKLPDNTRYQITVLSVNDGFIIEQNGYFYEQYDVVNTGYWAWKKLAELLPYDYVYE